MSYARLIRGDILSVRERDYVMAARVVGATDSRIMFQHIIPNAIYPTLVVASLDIGSVVVSFAALSFLGIGTEVGYADWGQLVSFARDWIPQLSKYWWIPDLSRCRPGIVCAGLEPGRRCAAGHHGPENAQQRRVDHLVEKKGFTKLVRPFSIYMTEEMC